MRPKKYLIISLLVLLSGVVQAQLRVNQVSEKQLDHLFETKTIFVYRSGDDRGIEKMERLLDSVWNVTDLEFWSYEEFADIEDLSGYSVFTMNAGYSGVYTGLRSSSSVTLDLWSKAEGVKTTYCRFALGIDMEYEDKASDFKNEKAMYKYLYTNADLDMWTLGSLLHTFKTIDQQLEKMKSWEISSDYYGKSDLEKMKLLRPLKTDTLLILEDVLEDWYVSSGEFKQKEKQDVATVFKDYPYPYKVVSKKQLSNIIVEAEDPVYYLTFLHNRTTYVNIYEARSGGLIYSQSSLGAPFNFGKLQMKHLLKAISGKFPKSGYGFY